MRVGKKNYDPNPMDKFFATHNHRGNKKARRACKRAAERAVRQRAKKDVSAELVGQ